MALANVAWLLATAGKKVLIIDWDLEAPGLHRYVHPFLDDPDLTSSEGLIDFAISYTEEASAQNPEDKLDPDWFKPYANLTRFATPLDHPFPNSGSLDFIPAGQQGPEYAARVNSFNWSDFYVHLGGRAVLEEARLRVRERYDFTLIDSRTGVSDTSGICTVQMPDAVVLCFTLNMQSVNGAAAAARSMLEQRTGNPLDLFPVAMRVAESSEKIKTEEVRAHAKKRFLSLMSERTVAQTDRDRYWHDVEVPQIPFYAFEEQLAYFLDSESAVSGVLASMKRLCGWLTGIVKVPAPDPDVRERIVARYSAVWAEAVQKEAAPVPKAAVYVSFGSGLPSVSLPAGTEMITSQDLPRTESWFEAFHAVLRRCTGMVLVRDGPELSPMQMRELAVALDYRSRLASPSDFSITSDLPGLTPANADVCPYPGLRAFETRDCAVFFGREAFLDHVAEEMRRAPAIVLGGKPGTGKSSAVRAGLVPRLLRDEAVWKTVVGKFHGDLVSSVAEALVSGRGPSLFERRRQVLDTPGALTTLAEEILSDWPKADRLAIIIDGVPPGHYSILNLIASLAKFISVVAVSEASQPGQIQIPEVSREDLIRAIERPALLAGTAIETGLAARIADDIGEDQDLLPLLQFCMLRLWELRRDRTIRIEDYERIGGASGVVDWWASAIVAPFSPEARQAAIRLLQRMVGIDANGEYESRPLPSDILTSQDRELAARLTDAGLLTVADLAVSLFHVRLALRWPLLNKAVTQNAEFLRWREKFQDSARAFLIYGSYSALLRGDALEVAKRWRAERPDEFTAEDVMFYRTKRSGIGRGREETEAPDLALALVCYRSAGN
jgi:hypothetical protein